MYIKKSYLTILFLMILCLFVSCDDNIESDTNKKNSPVNESVSTEINSETEEIFSIEAVDYNGMEYVILDVERTAGTFNVYYEEFNVNEITGEIISDNIFNRNNLLNEKYNINIKVVKDQSPSATIKKSVMADDKAYHLVNHSPNEGTSLSIAGMLLNLNNLDFVNFDNPWWISDSIYDSSIANKIYYAQSSANLASFNAVGVTCFSKEMATEYDLENPYDLVKTGKWTLDKLTVMSREVSEDINGDGEMTEVDKYGLATNNFVWQPAFYGTDSMFTKKDENDILYFDFNNERTIDILNKIVGLISDKTITFYGENFKNVIENGRAELPRKLFVENRALFWIELMYSIPTLRTMEFDFGILPMPKYNEEQEQYTTYLHNVGSSLMIPMNIEDHDMAGRILEDMAYMSYENVQSAYFEILLKGKISRDNETEEMLDLIYQSVRNDIVVRTGQISIDSSIRSMLDKTDTNFISLFNSNITAYETVLENINQSIINLK